MIITQEHLAETLVKAILQPLYDEYLQSGLGLDRENGSSFDEFVWNRLGDLGQAAYEAIGDKYGDLDEAAKEIME